MEVFKPLKRQFVPRVKTPATLALPGDEKEAAPPQVDAEVTEMHGDDGWQQWQDSVFVDEFTNEAMQTVPGALK